MLEKIIEEMRIESWRSITLLEKSMEEVKEERRRTVNIGPELDQENET